MPNGSKKRNKAHHFARQNANANATAASQATDLTSDQAKASSSNEASSPTNLAATTAQQIKVAKAAQLVKTVQSAKRVQLAKTNQPTNPMLPAEQVQSPKVDKNVKPVVPTLPKVATPATPTPKATKAKTQQTGTSTFSIKPKPKPHTTPKSPLPSTKPAPLTISAPLPILDALSTPALTPVISAPTLSIQTARQMIEKSHGLVSTPASCAAYIDLTKPIDIPKFGTIEYYAFMEEQGRDLGRGGRVGKKAAVKLQEEKADMNTAKEKEVKIMDKIVAGPAKDETVPPAVEIRSTALAIFGPAPFPSRRDKSGKGARARRDEKRQKIHYDKVTAATTATAIANEVAANITAAGITAAGIMAGGDIADAGEEEAKATDPFYAPLPAAIIRRSQDVRNEVGYARAAATASAERHLSGAVKMWLSPKGKGKGKAPLEQASENVSVASRGLSLKASVELLFASPVAKGGKGLVYRGPQADFKTRAMSDGSEVQSAGGLVGDLSKGGRQVIPVDKETGMYHVIVDESNLRLAGEGGNVATSTGTGPGASIQRPTTPVDRGRTWSYDSTVLGAGSPQYMDITALDDPFVDRPQVQSGVDSEKARTYFRDLTKHFRVDSKGNWHFKHDPGSDAACAAAMEAPEPRGFSVLATATAGALLPEALFPSYNPVAKDQPAAGNSKQYNSVAATFNQQFTRLQAFSKHNQVDGSPYFPKNINELIVHQKEFAAEKNKEEMNRLKARIHTKEAEASGSQVKIKPAFGGKNFNDGRSGVLGLESIFARQVDTSKMSVLEAELHEKPKVAWPGLNERKEYGEGRHQDGKERELPPPRMVDIIPEHVVWLINQGVNTREAINLLSNPGNVGKEALFWKFRKICDEYELDEIDYEVKDWCRAENAKDMAQRQHALAKLEGRSTSTHAGPSRGDSGHLGRYADMQGGYMGGIAKSFIKLKEGHYRMIKGGKELRIKRATELDMKEVEENGWNWI